MQQPGRTKLACTGAFSKTTKCKCRDQHSCWATQPGSWGWVPPAPLPDCLRGWLAGRCQLPCSYGDANKATQLLTAAAASQSNQQQRC